MRDVGLSVANRHCMPHDEPMPERCPCPACGWDDWHPPQRYATAEGRVTDRLLLRCAWCAAVFERPAVGVAG